VFNSQGLARSNKFDSAWYIRTFKAISIVNLNSLCLVSLNSALVELDCLALIVVCFAYL